jgi:hypothetical protein
MRMVPISLKTNITTCVSSCLFLPQLVGASGVVSILHFTMALYQSTESEVFFQNNWV